MNNSHFTSLNPQHKLFEELKETASVWWQFIKENIKPGGFYIDIRKDNSLNVYFVSMFPNMEKLHTSGHASTECLAEVCNLVNPALGIIPIHSENSVSYSNLPIKEHLQQIILTSSNIIGDVEIRIIAVR